jgi:hypothetical protein
MKERGLEGKVVSRVLHSHFHSIPVSVVSFTMTDKDHDLAHSSLLASKYSPFSIHRVSSHLANSASLSGRSAIGILFTSTWNLYPLFPLRLPQLKDSHISGAAKN